MSRRTPLGTPLLICRLVSLLALFFIPLQTAQAEISLRFGVYTTDQPTAMVKAYRPILERIETRLSEKLDEPVDIALKVASTYEKGVNALVTGAVHFSALGPASYIVAHERNPKLRILALVSKDGSKTFNGVIAVHGDSPIQGTGELLGKTFAFGNQKSTIGRYLAQAHLMENDLLAKDLKDYQYLGRHDRVGHAVANGKFDAGALKESTFKKLIKKGAQLRALTTIPNVNRPWVASSALDDRLVAALRESMLEIEDEEVFKALSRKQFVAGDDSDFDKIRNAINNNGEFFVDESAENPVATLEE